MHQAFNFHEIKRKMEALQSKESKTTVSEERNIPEKKQHSNKAHQQQKKRFDSLKIDDFLLYSTLGRFLICTLFNNLFRYWYFWTCSASENKK